MEDTPLKRALREDKLRQDWLAAKTGIDNSEISRMANRGMIPTADQAQRIADALERPVASLFPVVLPTAA